MFLDAPYAAGDTAAKLMSARLLACFCVVAIAGIAETAASAGHASPDGRWRCHGASVNRAAAVIDVKSSRVAWTAPDDMYVGTLCEDCGEFLWAPDSRRFAFNYAVSGRFNTTRFFQLEGARWRELAAVDDDHAIDLEDAIATQEKKAGMIGSPYNKRQVRGTSRICRWLDNATAELLVYEDCEEKFTEQSDLTSIGASRMFTLAFDKQGRWNVTKSRDLSEGERKKYLGEAQ